MAYGRPARLHGLARQGAAAGVDDAERGHERHPAHPVVEEAVDGEQRGLQVEGVDLGLDQQQVHAAVQQSACLLAVGRGQFVEGNGSESRIAHVGGDGGRPGGGPQGAGHEARSIGIGGHGGRGGPFSRFSSPPR